MFEMPAERLREFLDRPHAAVLSTLRKDGSPYTIPLWYMWEGEVPDDVHPNSNPPSGHVWFLGGATSTWVRHLQSDPRMSLCIDVEGPPAMHVGIDGTVEYTSELDDEAWSTMRRLIARYLTSDEDTSADVDGYMESTHSMSPVLFKVTPRRWRTIDLTEFVPGQDM